MTLDEKLDLLAKAFRAGGFGKVGSHAARKAYAKAIAEVKREA